MKHQTKRTMDKSGAPLTAWFLCLVYICLCLNNCFDQNLGNGTKSPLMMACFAQNGISLLMVFSFWPLLYYYPDASEQSFPGKSKEMRAKEVGVDGNIGAKKCWKLVDNVSREIICLCTTCSKIEPGTANLQVDPLEPRLEENVESDQSDGIIDEFMSLTDFDTPFCMW